VKLQRFWPLLIVLTLLFHPGRAGAQDQCSAHCTGYQDDGEILCTGSNGCTGSYEAESCALGGCTCGTCYPKGSSGECCSRIYYIPNVYPMSGSCNTIECGDASIHARSHLSRNDGGEGRNSAELRQAYSPGLIMLTPTLSYREPSLLYVLDRCSHTYRLVAEQGRTVKNGGM
jgi:hypothetical protein